jgi:tRNA 2-thiouridine synthesizing protein A
MTHELDVMGLACPLPVLKAKKRLKELAPGDMLVVQATDPSAVKDFEAFCELTGHALVSRRAEGDVFTFEIRKA